jgi:hypothetical protein
MPSNGMTDEIDPLPLIRRQLVWDSSDHTAADAVCAAVGLAPVSDEVMTMDHRASHVRMLKVAPFVATLALLAQEMAGIHATLFERAVELAGEKMDISRDDIEARYLMIIASSAMAIVSQLMDAGLLTYGEYLHE